MYIYIYIYTVYITKTVRPSCHFSGLGAIPDFRNGAVSKDMSRLSHIVEVWLSVGNATWEFNDDKLTI